MTPIQQMFLGLGAEKKTYIDDLFNTYLWAGSGSARSINNGIDLSGEGGMVWIKNRTYSTNKHVINDTVRGHSNAIMADVTDANTTQAGLLDGFNSNGFDVSTDNFVNGSSQDYASWSFRKAPGFLDIVTWTGDGNNHKTISHSLGSIPGMILIKNTSSQIGWCVYHRGINGGVDPQDYNLTLETANAQESYMNRFYNTAPTSSAFTVGSSNRVNTNGDNYVAYVFAGGDPQGYGSTFVTSDTNGLNGNHLVTGAHSDFAFGTDPFTVEGWFKVAGNNGTYNTLFSTREDQYDNGGDAFSFSLSGDNVCAWAGGWIVNASAADIDATDGNWHHVAFVREGTGSNEFHIYHNGTDVAQGTLANNLTKSRFGIGNTTKKVNNPEAFWGSFSNVRVIKNQALYTSNFTPSTSPLTTVSQSATDAKVVLLCCNTNKPARFSRSSCGLEARGDGVLGKTDSPFTAPATNIASQIYGVNGDQDAIYCGSYTGNGDTTGPIIEIGWEPQYVLVKNTSTGSTGWTILDSMRGIIRDNNDVELYAEVADAETNTNGNRMWLTPTGFRIASNASYFNTNGDNYIFMAIRRSDGYIGAPASAGTSVFGMSTGTADSSIPLFSGTFPVDLSMHRAWASNSTWYNGARLFQGKYLRLDTSNQEASHAPINYAFNAGWNNQNVDASASQSWHWKRHAGLDVITYLGLGTSDRINGITDTGRKIPHNLNGVPEMIWIKNANAGEDWQVYHHGLNGGSSPATRRITLNNNNAEDGNGSYVWNDVAPTATHFTLGTDDSVNKDNCYHVAYLFRSIAGICKVGYYTGTGSSGNAQTLGFTPRFLIVKRSDSSGGWSVTDSFSQDLDASGDEKYLDLNTESSQYTGDYFDTTATGFTFTGAGWNASTAKYIYYAHA